MIIKTLIIHYNNSIALADTVRTMLDWNIPAEGIVVLDNASKDQSRAGAAQLCTEQGLALMYAPQNLGWGAAVNYFIGNSIFDADDVLLIAAHDALIERFDHREIEGLFQNPRVAIVCPQYPEPITCDYSIARSFYCRPGLTVGPVLVGHGTACLVRPTVIQSIKYDEECFIYGCENEIFLRIRSGGYETRMCRHWVVRNPGTDAPASLPVTAYTLNSMYIAYRHHGWTGLLRRASVVFLSSTKLLMTGHPGGSALKAQCLLFALMHPGQGFRSFKRRTHAEP